MTSRLRHTNGRALALEMKSLMASRKSSLVGKLAPRRALRVSRPNHTSTRLSQLADVGVKWKTTLPSY